MRILLFCEADADARTARFLVDQVLAHHGPAWVRETLEAHPEGVRSWVRDEAPSRDWYDVHRVQKQLAELRLKPVHGHFGGKPGEPGALMLANIARIARHLDRADASDAGIGVLMLLWDMDKQGPTRREGLVQGAEHVPEAMALVLGRPDPIRETWVLAGFEPATEREHATLDELRRELGFWPHREPHRLTAQSTGAKRDGKRVAAALAIADWDREQLCLRIGTEERRTLLAERGADCGLAAFLEDVERHVLAAVVAPPRP